MKPAPKPKRKLARVAQKTKAKPAPCRYLLRLFVAGATARSHQAITTMRELCDGPLKGRVRLEVVDIYQQPGLARDNQIVATPTLIVAIPLPLRRFIGNLSNLSHLFTELDEMALVRHRP